MVFPVMGASRKSEQNRRSGRESIYDGADWAAGEEEGAMRAIAIAFCTMLPALPSAFAGECADQTQAGLNACADAAYQKADAALNRAYKEILRRLSHDAATTKLLVTAQKAWIAYRDAECAFSSSANSGGSIYPMAVSICLEAVAKERTKQLDALLKCGEGDMGCPVPAQ
jgi:uncharacterized protein YecT (DUF1311 family)